MSFVNLSVAEIYHALDLFCSFVDEETYALFYYNGHAVGANDETYLAATDSRLTASEPVDDHLIWHGEIQRRMCERKPLLGVAVFDSCRDAAPADVAEALRRGPARPKPGIKRDFYTCYGTRSENRSYEYTTRDMSQGLYLKHLLRHIGDEAGMATVLERVAHSFVGEEDQSITERMTPEFRLAAISALQN